jgi:hypothetical protein
MIEDEKADLVELRPDDHRYSESLTYDLAKFLTTLSLLALGGVLTITETADRTDIKVANIVLVAIALAGATAISAITATSIAYARSSSQPIPRNLHRYISTTMGLLSVGLGMFLYMWIDKLN